MASKGGGSETLQYSTWVLKVSIHCDCEGCKKKVRRILQNVAGVYTIEIDSQQNKVTVTGIVEAETLIRKLLKSGENAELWPVEKTKPNNPNPSPSPNPNNSNEKGKDSGTEKQKDASKSNEPNGKKTEKPPEKSPAAAKPETDTKPAETAALAEQLTPATEPAETDTKSVAGTEVLGINIIKETSKPDPKPEKPLASSESETKLADTFTKIDSGKKKVKKESVVASKEEFFMHSGGSPAVYQVPAAYPQPVYTASYSMAHPTASYSYYAPIPTMPQSYMYSGHPPPQPPPPEYYPHYQQYPPPLENYYGPMEPPASSSAPQSQGSYDFFSDENANSCNVM